MFRDFGNGRTSKSCHEVAGNTLSEIANEIAGEIAVKLCTLVFISKINVTAISPAISLATSRGVY